MKTAAQKEANRVNAAKRRREQPEHVREIQRRCYANGGAERERERRQRRKREDFFGYHVQFVRRYNPAVTVADIRDLWEAQEGRCGLTGWSMEAVAGRAQVDHVIPHSRGGSHDLSNLRWVCTEANHAKRNLTDKEFLNLCASVGEWIGRRLIEVTA